jgi:hypothetical protein
MTIMVKLTVLYNLPPEMDEAEFVKWRLEKHQGENASKPGVVRTDFAIAVNEPDGSPPRYRFITEAWYNTMDELKASFYGEETQAELAKAGEWCKDRLFLLSEEKAVTIVQG